MNVKAIAAAVANGFQLRLFGIHGVVHWGRVYENALRLAEETGADLEVLTLFALFHDSKRFNEGSDRAHGKRGAELAKELRGELFDLDETRFETLYFACAHHTDGVTHDDVTIQTCWDADRLDLARVGIVPDPDRLGTPAAKRADVVLWAIRRSTSKRIPDIVSQGWGIQVPQPMLDGNSEGAR